MAGRKTKLTPELQARMVEFVAAGNYLSTAAAACGVAESTVHGWIARGRRSKSGIYLEFLESIKKASAEAESKAVGHVLAAAELPTYWQAAATFLERRFKSRWARSDRNRTRLDVYDWREAARKDGHDPEKLLEAAVKAIEVASGAGVIPATVQPAGDVQEADDAL